MKTSRQGAYHLQEESSPFPQTLGPVRVALKQNVHNDALGTSHDDCANDEDAERTEILLLCCCLDEVIGQLHKQVKLFNQFKGNLRSTSSL